MCDTFVNIDRSSPAPVVIFGKNSDREPNEAQILEFHPSRQDIREKTVRCTYIEIPQVKDTRSVLISRPFWMWGAEIGVNDAGVSIGNEAVFTKMPMLGEKKLLGMDMLRLALERSASAEEALEVIIALLRDHGQGGPCGYEDRKLVYHNSFIISDMNEAWVLETAGPYWAARKVESCHTISNGLTIGREFDRTHPGLIDNTIKKGWLRKGDTFSFKDTYSDWFFTTFSRCTVRREQTLEQLKTNKGRFNLRAAFNALRNHNGENNYSPGSHPFMNTVCSHAGLPVSRHASQSTASMVTEIKDGQLTVWATGTSAPCLSMFKPFRFTNTSALPDHTPGEGGKFDRRSIWWRHEMFHRRALVHYTSDGPLIRSGFESIEEKFFKELKANGNSDFESIARSAYREEERFKENYLEEMKTSAGRKRQNLIFRKYWDTQNKKAGLSLD